MVGWRKDLEDSRSKLVHATTNPNLFRYRWSDDASQQQQPELKHLSALARHGGHIDASRELCQYLQLFLATGAEKRIKNWGGKDGAGGLVSVEEGLWGGRRGMHNIDRGNDRVFGSKNRMMLIIPTIISKGWNPEDSRGRELQRPHSDEECLYELMFRFCGTNLP